MPLLYQLSPSHTLSIQKLRHALQLIVAKHESLRTSFNFDAKQNQLMQHITDFNDGNNQLFAFIESTFETNEQLTEIMHDEKRNSRHFDLAQSLVFRCHLAYYKEISSDDLLCDKDAIIFNFHHALFDFPSMDVFLKDLNQVYTNSHLPIHNDTDLRYLDCKF